MIGFQAQQVEIAVISKIQTILYIITNNESVQKGLEWTYVCVLPCSLHMLVYSFCLVAHRELAGDQTGLISIGFK